ncbi:25S rRNA (uridine-N(3))-methyltransferase [Paramyrothecium foliicola]|nr:25S rRNA (uridine-N(3))-methyltransferase [Paramyrothecium foliicola]
MGKRRKLQQQAGSRPGRPQSHPSQKKKGAAGDSAGGPPPPPPKKKQQHHQQNDKPSIPFEPEDRILLVGEGDLSFAASIVEHHGCLNVTATVFEKDAAELQEKYPHVEANVEIIHGKAKEGSAPGDSSSDGGGDDDDHGDIDEPDEVKRKSTSNRVVYGIDATKPLPSSVARPPYDRIIFNFPHVGGKSTDVNRQVRYNQELLVSFFQRSALPSLAPGGSIVVTLFEGEPYTLWNVRDLGRHAGLQVERSFAFRADAYPGYHHARTLGVVRNKKGEVGGGWRGEQRPARSYVFMRKGDVPQPTSKKRRRRGDDDDDSSSDDD